MGQKVSPVGLRIGINKDWEAKWYASNSDFKKYLANDIKIREYFSKNLKDAGIAKVEIERNNKRCEIIVHTSKPGVIIGRGGEEIEKLLKMTRFSSEEAILRFAKKLRKLGIDDELEKMGAREGDIVKILDFDFLYRK